VIEDASVAKVLFNTFKELTAAGLSGIYTRFPFNYFQRVAKSKPLRGKGK